jgi:hypothetical protein
MAAAYKHVTATGDVTSVPTLVTGIVHSDSAAGTVTLTDGNGGNTVLAFRVTTTMLSFTAHFNPPIRFDKSVYATITGTAPKLTILTA